LDGIHVHQRQLIDNEQNRYWRLIKTVHL